MGVFFTCRPRLTWCKSTQELTRTKYREESFTLRNSRKVSTPILERLYGIFVSTYLKYSFNSFAKDSAKIFPKAFLKNTVQPSAEEDRNAHSVKGSLHELITWSTFGKHENSSLLKNNTSWKGILTWEFLAVYLKSSDCNGRQKLEAFVWEKQLLSPNHACMVFRHGTEKLKRVALVKATKHKANPATGEARVENQDHGLARSQSGNNRTVARLLNYWIQKLLAGV